MKRDKPHLWFKEGIWWCATNWSYRGRGDTPADAYRRHQIRFYAKAWPIVETMKWS